MVLVVGGDGAVVADAIDQPAVFPVDEGKPEGKDLVEQVRLVEAQEAGECRQGAADRGALRQRVLDPAWIVFRPVVTRSVERDAKS